MEQKSVFVEVSLTPEDVYSFQKAYIYQKFPRGGIIALSLFFIVLSIISFIDSSETEIVPLRSLLCLIFPIIFLVVIPVFLKKNSKAVLTTSKLLQKAQSYQISDQGIKATSPSAEVNIKWEELYKANETKDSFQFFLSKAQAYVIPKRCFDNSEEQFVLLRIYMKNAPIPKEEKKRTRRLVGGFLAYVILFFAVLIVMLLYGSK